VRSRLQEHRGHRLVDREHSGGRARGRGQGRRDRSQPRVVRGRRDARPHREPDALPLPGDGEDRLPAGL
ncbi:MAG: Dodecin (COG3360) Flavin-binding, partial [uncultured Solirubrobacteraceae bacterium]